MTNTGLGDYIHLKKENYLKYGFFRKNKSNLSSQSYASAAMHAYKTLQSLVKSIHLKGDVHQIEEILTSIYRQNWNDPIFQNNNINLSNISEQENQLASAVESNIATNMKFNRDTMGLKNINIQSEGDKRYRSRIGKEQQAKRKSTITKLTLQVNKDIKYLQQLLLDGQINATKVQEKIVQLRSYNSILIQELQKANANGIKMIPIRNSDSTLNEIGNIISNIGALRMHYGLPLPEDLGITGELGALAALKIADNKINFTAEELIQGLVGGKAFGSANKQVSSSIYASFNLGENKQSNIRSTQDTVDISLSVNNTELFGKNIINASVKNYSNFSHGIKLISGVTLETILGLTGNAFGNHYLNRMVQHEDGDLDTLPFGDNIVAYALAVRAITGARYLGFNKLSNYLIAYNRSANFVKVYSSYDILNRICSTPSSFNYSLVDIHGLDLNKSKYPNISEESGASARISKIMTQVRAEKLSMSLSPRFFNI